MQDTNVRKYQLELKENSAQDTNLTNNQLDIKKNSADDTNAIKTIRWN